MWNYRGAPLVCLKKDHSCYGVGLAVDPATTSSIFTSGVAVCVVAGELMKVKIKPWHAIAQWRWDTGNVDNDKGNGKGGVCGICRVPYEGCNVAALQVMIVPLASVRRLHLVSWLLVAMRYGVGAATFFICTIS